MAYNHKIFYFFINLHNTRAIFFCYETGCHQFLRRGLTEARLALLAEGRTANTPTLGNKGAGMGQITKKKMIRITDQKLIRIKYQNPDHRLKIDTDH